MAQISPEPNSGCWLWTASLKGTGYAQFYANGRNWRAHRWMYEQLVGPIPPGLQLDHKCRVRSCVNPDHLEPVTNAENVRRAALTGKFGKGNSKKTHCKRGHPFDEKNTRRTSRGRSCRRCMAGHQRSRYYALKAMRAASENKLSGKP